MATHDEILGVIRAAIQAEQHRGITFDENRAERTLVERFEARYADRPIEQLRRIARVAVWNISRDEARRSNIERAAGQRRAEQRASAAHAPGARERLMVVLEKVVESLDAPDREVLRRVLRGEPRDAIAGELGISRSALYRRMEAIFAHLREEFELRLADDPVLLDLMEAEGLV